MPSASSTPATEPHWREQGKLDELLELVRDLRAKADERIEPTPLVITAGTRLVAFPNIRKADVRLFAGSLSQQRFQLYNSSAPYDPMFVELFGQGENVLAMRFGIANILSPLFEWELFG